MQLTWDEARALPVMMFHFAGGPPTMAHVQQSVAGFRLWAPAQVTMNGPSGVVFLPVPFVDKYLDVMFTGIRGTNPVQEVILRGYAGFFELFAKDGFQMKPVLIPAGIDVEGGAPTVDLPTVASKVPEGAEEPAPLEPCPGCGQELSNWQAHYPVIVPVLGSLDGKWECEVTMSNIREVYPNYTPPDRPKLNSESRH